MHFLQLLFAVLLSITVAAALEIDDSPRYDRFSGSDLHHCHHCSRMGTTSKRESGHCSVQKREQVLRMVPQGYNALQAESESIFRRLPFSSDNSVSM
jgi:hypothetical protein